MEMPKKAQRQRNNRIKKRNEMVRVGEKVREGERREEKTEKWKDDNGGGERIKKRKMLK